MVLITQLRKKGSQIEKDLDTCSECSMEEMVEYIFAKVKLMLEK